MPNEERTDSQQDDNLKAAYQQVCSSIQAIDDFRATLLGFLPLVSGAGVFLLLNDAFSDPKRQSFFSPFLGPIGLFGFVITLALFGSVATLQECFDKLGRYGPRTLSRRSVQMAPI